MYGAQLLVFFDKYFVNLNGSHLLPFSCLCAVWRTLFEVELVESKQWSPWSISWLKCWKLRLATYTGKHCEVVTGVEVCAIFICCKLEEDLRNITVTNKVSQINYLILTIDLVTSYLHLGFSMANCWIFIYCSKKWKSN